MKAMTTEKGKKAENRQNRDSLSTTPSKDNGRLPGERSLFPVRKEQIDNAIQALNSIELSTLTGEQIDQATSMASLQKAVEQLQMKAAIAKHDIDQLVNDWLATFASQSTKQGYRNAINCFFTWLKVNRLHALTVDSQAIDGYAAFCRAEFKAAAANIRINAIGSLYSILQKWNVRPSPCIKIKRASTDYTVKTIPTDDQTKQMTETAPTAIGAAMELMAKTGLRIGSLHSLKVNRRHYTGRSKGKTIAGVLPDGITAGDIAMIQSISKVAFVKAVNRHMGKSGFTPHDLRHSFAIKVYRESGKDIEQVRRALGHSNIAITTTYLQGLPTE